MDLDFRLFRFFRNPSLFLKGSFGNNYIELYFFHSRDNLSHARMPGEALEGYRYSIYSAEITVRFADTQCDLVTADIDEAVVPDNQKSFGGNVVGYHIAFFGCLDHDIYFFASDFH